jgi:uncharacterized protein YdiU (UPF0061 family)
LATESINAFAARIDLEWLEGMRAKLGLTGEDSRDRDIAQSLLRIMQRTEADFTLTFRELCAFADSSGPRALGALGEDEEFKSWLSGWEARCALEPRSGAERAAAMRAVNPRYIPRNHRIEELIEAAAEHGNFAPFNTLLTVLAKPFDEQPEFAAYATPPRPEQRVARTFCGT